MADIDKLEPGRELDALVAEKVMGWRRLPYRKPKYSSGMAYTHSWPQPWPVGTRWMLPGGVTTPDMVSWSTDIAAAWEVVEKHRGEWHTVVTCEDETLWSCYIDSLSEGEYDESGWRKRLGEAWSNKSAPHAICLAALKAVSDD